MREFIEAGLSENQKEGKEKQNAKEGGGRGSRERRLPCAGFLPDCRVPRRTNNSLPSYFRKSIPELPFSGDWGELCLSRKRWRTDRGIKRHFKGSAGLRPKCPGILIPGPARVWMSLATRALTALSPWHPRRLVAMLSHGFRKLPERVSELCRKLLEFSQFAHDPGHASDYLFSDPRRRHVDVESGFTC